VLEVEVAQLRSELDAAKAAAAAAANAATSAERGAYDSWQKTRQDNLQVRGVGRMLGQGQCRGLGGGYEACNTGLMGCRLAACEQSHFLMPASGDKN
jgi:hypothetical protein